MIYGDTHPIPAHLLDLAPDDLDCSLDEVRWTRGAIVVGLSTGGFSSIEIVTPLWGVSVEANERHAVEVAVEGFRVGYVQHRLGFGFDVSDDEVRKALVIATHRGDLDIADLLDAAVERGIGPVAPAPAPTVGGLRH